MNYVKACSLKEIDGCVMAALYYERGTGIPQDDAKARECIEKACDLKNVVKSGKPCMSAGNYWLEARGAERDYQKAGEYF